MVAIHPFRALRYDPARVGDLSRVLAPPYDIIDPEEQERLYDASPYNVVRLILGRQHPTDTEADNRYTRTARDFRAWRDDAILAPDAAPALYLIQQTFSDGKARHSRLGFLALLGLEGADGRAIYRHEATLAAPKADRTRLLEAVPANLEPIFCVYPDEQGAMQRVLEGMAERLAPIAQPVVKGEQIRLWAVTDAEAIAQARRHLSGTAVLIADGHHRFEVAYAHRATYPSLMSFFVSMADPALVVRPIHRVVARQRAVEALAGQSCCSIEPAANLDAVLRWLGEDGARGRFGCYDGRRLVRVQLAAEALAAWLMAPTVPLPVATLDVSLLHGVVLPRLGADEAGVRYFADAAQALAAAQQAPGGGAWLLRGIPLAQVYALAAQGMTLAPKSTYFYPKVPSGLAINPLDLPS